MDNLISIFKDKKLKLTPQRIAVYKYLKSTVAHPSAEAIYNAIHDEYPTMSLATVYKTLKTLVEVGLVQELNVGENNFRYDANTDAHPHIQCIKCGKVDDIFDLNLENLNKDAEQNSKYTVLSSQVYFYGVCPDCNNRD
ncbi:Fur family transcriptional regulator [Inconstantimicrobium mannanitabidum]|uniref:Transcriptional regulator PerR n=1 Tax=Inconstantimicrobium mannanitabidum TaxID=1604901 RepID=A0ACB5RCN8_9CLOT|nr:Fur family transcriptional regulator [Clostridium sp. TW13]GKX66910.1 transcriptional regulator PerR [Clostridium sp. TW13]